MIREKKHNYFYKITNLINGKFYYGIHSTNDLDDGYMGSGLALKSAYNKYGKENFIKEIINNFKTRKDASDCEKSIVDLHLIESPECYNMQTGGLNGNIPSIESRKKLSEANTGKKRSDAFKQLMSNMKSGEKHPYYGCAPEDAPMFGKIHSDTAKKKMSIARTGTRHSDATKKKLSESRRGSLNHQYGKPIPDEQKQKMRYNRTDLKPCIVNGINFISVSSVYKHFGISKSLARYRLKSKSDRWINWNYAD